jgi:pyruvate carboxylase
VGKVDLEGNRTLFFEVDGFRREIKIKDKNSKNVQKVIETRMADTENLKEVGSPIPGTILSVLVKEGDIVKENEALIIVEAMKMETRVTASVSGTVQVINVKEGQQVSSGELLVTIK